MFAFSRRSVATLVLVAAAAASVATSPAPDHWFADASTGTHAMTLTGEQPSVTFALRATTDARTLSATDGRTLYLWLQATRMTSEEEGVAPELVATAWVEREVEPFAEQSVPLPDEGSTYLQVDLDGLLAECPANGPCVIEAEIDLSVEGGSAFIEWNASLGLSGPLEAEPEATTALLDVEVLDLGGVR